MQETSSSERVSTKLQRIAKLAGQDVTMVLVTLAHHIDVEFLKEAFRRSPSPLSTGRSATLPTSAWSAATRRGRLQITSIGQARTECRMEQNGRRPRLAMRGVPGVGNGPGIE